MVEGFESSVLGLLFIYLFIYLFIFLHIFIITVSFGGTFTKTAEPQVLGKSSDWGNDVGGD